jgi:hypothetical protein
MLSEGLAAATAVVGEKMARRMVYDMPQKILNGQYIDLPDPLPIRRKRTFFDLLNKFLQRN